MIQAFDRLDQDSGRTLLKGLDEKGLYDAALTVMMRLVFLFSAEERGLLHLGEPLYDENYAVSTLREQLQEVADHYGEEVLERRHDGWARLLASFRAVHGGVNHQDLMLPAYGGSLFDPDRYPFLEGRAQGTRWKSSLAAPLEINNRVVLHLLKSLQMLQVKVPGGGPAEALRVSFEGLNIEQIGHVYEGLLDHTAVRAKEVVLGLAASRKKPVASMTLAEIEKLRHEDELQLIEVLQEETGRSAKALENVLKNDADTEDFHKIMVACGQDKELAERIIRFRGLLRQDSFERLVVVLPGGIYVGQGSARRSTGTHYTPRSLTEPIVQHTLEPLVYLGPAEGLPKEQWRLRPPKEILDLKVCDMAMGSGAFLVQACRYLSERLVEAWENLEKEHPGEVLITPEGGFSKGEPSERLIPKEAAERLAIARRLVADRCLYGVDINPMAVEMAKLSIWLITVDKSRPFTFLDHALKCGDSLVGVNSLSQIENFSLRPRHKQITFSTANLFRYVEEATTKRLALEALPSDHPDQIESKHNLNTEAETATAKVKALADCVIALEFRGADGKVYEDQRIAAADSVELEMRRALPEFQRYASGQLNGRRTFHWPVEFPEVLARGGFDAFVGNPPFIGNKYWAERLGDRFQPYAEVLTGGKVGKIDVVALFYRRAFSLLAEHGRGGLIATTTAREGATQQVGFGWISGSGEIYRAMSQMAWPGQAGVHVCIVWFGKIKSLTRRILDDSPVETIPPTLVGHSDSAQPYQLHDAPWGFQGSHNGKGECFLLTAENSWFTRLKAVNSPFLRPYITGDDITTGTFRNPPRWCIDCEDLTLDQVRIKCKETFRFLTEVAEPVRTAEALAPYKGLIDRWWQMWNHRAPLYRQLRQQEFCITMPMVAKHLDVAQLPTKYVFTNKVCVLKKPDSSQLTVLLSSIFELWVIEHGGTMGAGRLTIVLSTGIQTFPMPRQVSLLIDLGEQYYNNWDGLMLSRSIGFTDAQNSFHNPDENSAGIHELRMLRVEMDQAVAAAYGWGDIGLDHGFHETKQGVRYTLSDTAREIVLGRLMTLNQQRYKEELNLGLHEKKAKGSSTKRASSNNVEENTAQGGLY